MPLDNQLDLAFVVDMTGSMAPLIAAAKRQMVDLVDRLARAADVDLRLAIVEYRDHPPQDQIVTRVHAFAGDLNQARSTIGRLQAQGGGDGPEAVLDGVLAACRELSWRRHARRIAVLVGDSPPHGTGMRADASPNGCPCDETIETVSAAAGAVRAPVYALGLTRWVADAFGTLSHLTGGSYFPADRAEEAMEQLESILQAEFGDLGLDRRVLDARQSAPEADVELLANTIRANATGWRRRSSASPRGT